MIRVHVKQISQDPHGQPFVLLRDADDEKFPIWIGHNEALAILTQLKGQQLPRPMTHDLITNILETLDVMVHKVAVIELRDDTFYAVITIETNGKIIEMDARPSDSIALALRTDAPIFISEDVAEKVMLTTRESSDETPTPVDPEQMQRFHRLLDENEAPEDDPPE